MPRLHVATGLCFFLYSAANWKHAIECAIQQASNLIGPDGVVVPLSDNKEAKKMLSNHTKQHL